MEHQPYIVHRKRSFLSQAALGISVFAVAVILSATAVVIYGMRILDGKTDDLAGFVTAAVKGLPELERALPPVLADVLDDRRDPDYRRQIEIKATAYPDPHDQGRHGIAVEIENRGDELVSLLSFRLVAFDAQGVPRFERNWWAATPFAADDDWPGPLMPGARRYLTSRAVSSHRLPRVGELRVEVEVTDIRVWRRDSAVSAPVREERTY
jgi:hypothetical protein